MLKEFFKNLCILSGRFRFACFAEDAWCTSLAAVIFMLFFAGYSAADQSVRKPFYAGKLYPDKEKELKRIINDLIEKSGKKSKTQGEKGELKGLIMPFGSIGRTGSSNALISRLVRGKGIKKVILMGQDNRLFFNGISVSSFKNWQTPLGNISVHDDAAELRQKHPLRFRNVPFSERTDFSIESVLPFFQSGLKEFKILPMIIGRADIGFTVSEISKLLPEKKLASGSHGEKTLLVAVSNLSENLNSDKASLWDRKTIELIMALDGSSLIKRRNSACGIFPVLILMEMAENFKWRPHLLHYSNSGSGNSRTGKVTGYAAIAFYGGKSMSAEKSGEESLKFSKDQGLLLLRIARRAIAKKLGYKTDRVMIPDDPIFRSNRGTFVTLKRDKNLRGCIGNISADFSVTESVEKNALHAAFNDNRFKPLSKEELEDVDIEVSILTEPVLLKYKDSSDLIKKLRPGKDGVIIRKGYAGATFLPQVWEQLPEPSLFLEHLCLKAGLPADAWQNDNLEILTYQVQYFEE